MIDGLSDFFIGILMWEIFTCGEMPYGKFKNPEVVEGVCHRNLRLAKPPKCPEPVYEIMYSCWLEVSDS